MSGLHIGLDLDNTIICYDRAFVEVGNEIGLLPPGHDLRSKDEVKSFLCKGERGEEDWMRLQGQVYGRYIGRACLCDGIDVFFVAMRKKKARISIVSHKTRYGHFDPLRVNLWDAARSFLEKQGIFAGSGFGLDRTNLHFSESREGKLQTIARIGCEVFVDDLPEVLLHPMFPKDTLGLWFAAQKSASDGDTLVPYRDWTSLLAKIEELAQRRGSGRSGAPMR